MEIVNSVNKFHEKGWYAEKRFLLLFNTPDEKHKKKFYC